MIPGVPRGNPRLCVCRDAGRAGAAGDRSVCNIAGGADGGIGRAGANAGGRYDEDEGLNLKIKGAGVSSCGRAHHTGKD